MRNRLFLRIHTSNCRPYLSKADHLLRFHIPSLQTQTTNDFDRIERGSLWRLQLHYIIEDLRQPIEWDSGIQMVNVMVTNIASKPAHDWTGFHKTGGFQRGFLVRPSISSVERNPREVVLGIEQVGSNSARDEVREQQSQQQRLPAEEHCEQYPCYSVYHQSDQAIVVFT